MKVTDFTRYSRVAAAIDDLNASCKNKEYSDIIDARGRQYVDLVMEGGGVLGIALVGYTYALEQAGIRFLGVGGTSAGAINALLLAGLGKPEEPKSIKTLNILADLNINRFVDGDTDAVDFCEALVERSGIAKIMWKGWQVLDNISDDLGLNPGQAFFDWLAESLSRAGVNTVAGLKKQMVPPELMTRTGNKIAKRDYGARLALVAADITTETKVVFPDMADLYWRNHNTVNPANFVRASMSVPMFFHPFRVSGIPNDDRAKKRWDDKASYRGEIPAEVLFVDGGIMSNFPIDLFHAPGVPTAPTFGAKLGVDRSKPTTITKIAQLGGAVFDAARHCADYDFLIRNRDYRKLVTFIQTGDHHWLNFFMTNDEKKDLFALGVEAGVKFLKEFNWQKYKEIRAANTQG
ncbi:MAG: patatin-like phospholipase family protein [candidate division Zixibacteria bacterium]|nr:patatin-like phospholipase family protein [candidate division Zixibacteria bacterium]